jgi:FMN reductase
MHVLAIDGSPQGGGRTRTALDAVLHGAADAGATTEVVGLATGIDAALARLDAADALVFGSPVYRASFATPLKELLDHSPRGMWGETEEPLRAKPAGLVLTGATFHHYLAVDGLRNVLAGFFAMHVLSPGLYVPSEGYDEAKALLPAYVDLAASQGRGLVELATAVAAGSTLREIRPQA